VRADAADHTREPWHVRHPTFRGRKRGHQHEYRDCTTTWTSTQYLSLPPEIPEPIGRELGVTHRMLNIIALPICFGEVKSDAVSQQPIAFARRFF
jgi:hypothetical protein